MKLTVFYSSLLVCLVYVNVGFSLPATQNVTDSLAPEDHQITEDEAFDLEKNEDTKLNTLDQDVGDEMGIIHQPSSHKPRNDLPSTWETRGVFSNRRGRGRGIMYRSPFSRRGRDRYGMSPRSLSKGRKYRRRRFPGGFGGFASYGRYDRDDYNMMGNYQPYPQRYGGSAAMYDRQPYAPPQTFPSYQQIEAFPPQSQYSTSRPQSYPRPQTAAQSYYRDPYSPQSQQPQQFATAPPSYFPDEAQQQMNDIRPQSAPSSYYTNGPVGSELQRVDQFSQFGAAGQPTSRRAGAGSRTLTTPAQRTDRYQPTNELEIPPTGSFNRFGTSSLQPTMMGERNGAGSRTLVTAPTTIQGNRDRLQRTAPLDQFRTPITQSTDQRNGNGASADGLKDSRRENGDGLVESEEFQRTMSNPTTGDQLKSSSTSQSNVQSDGSQPGVETASASATQENGGQSRPLSGLFSFFGGQPSATTTETNNPQTRSIVDFVPAQDIREQLKPSAALVQSQAAKVAA